MFFGILNVSGEGTAQYQFMGGSGRFEDATGDGTLEAFLDVSQGLENVPRVVTWDVVIDY